MSPRDVLPEYVEQGGRQVWRPPYAARHAEVFGFMLATDRSAIDLLLQRDLVEPSLGTVDYRAAFDYLIVLVADIARMSCAEPPDSELGFLREREVGVWCLAADARAAGRLVWYLPYVFTDSGQTVATGREVYGYAKQLGIFDEDFPAKIADGGVSTVSALAFHPYAHDQQAALLPMISVEALAPLAEQGPLGDLADFLSLFSGAVAMSPDVPSGPAPEPSAVITAPGASPPRSAAPPPPWVRRVLDGIRDVVPLAEQSILIADMAANPTLVFLKQIHDVGCSTKACYQAVTEAPFEVDPLSYRELSAQDFRVTVANWDSHPIATELGLPASVPLAPARAFRARLHFQTGLGYEVWRAPT